MSKNVKLVTLAVILGSIGLTGNAIASDVKNEIGVETHVGVKSVKDTDVKSFNYGVTVKDTIDYNNHRPFVSAGIEQTKEKNTFDFGDKSKIRTYDVKAGYGYKYPVNYQLNVEPVVNIGYEGNKFSANDYTLKLNRTYGEIGANADYLISKDWVLGAGASYQRDIHVSAKEDYSKLDGANRGHGYNTNVSIKRNLPNESSVTFKVYHDVYKNKDTLEAQVNSTGVGLNYVY